MNIVLKVLGAIFGLEVAVPVVYLLVVFGGSLFGISTYVIESGSMEPTIPTGSLVYADSNFNAEDLAPDEVIVFELGGASAKACTHRVVLNDADSQSVRTKGDSNKEIDATPIPYTSVIGRVVISIPYLGFIVYLVSMNRLAILGAYLGALFVTLLLYSFIRKKKRSYEKRRSYEYGIKSFGTYPR